MTDRPDIPPTEGAPERDGDTAREAQAGEGGAHG